MLYLVKPNELSRLVSKYIPAKVESWDYETGKVFLSVDIEIIKEIFKRAFEEKLKKGGLVIKGLQLLKSPESGFVCGLEIDFENEEEGKPEPRVAEEADTQPPQDVEDYNPQPVAPHGSTQQPAVVAGENEGETIEEAVTQATEGDPNSNPPKKKRKKSEIPSKIKVGKKVIEVIEGKV